MTHILNSVLMTKINSKSMIVSQERASYCKENLLHWLHVLELCTTRSVTSLSLVY